MINNNTFILHSDEAEITFKIQREAERYQRRIQRKHSMLERKIQARTTSGYPKSHAPAPRHFKVVENINYMFEKLRPSKVIKKDPDPLSVSSIKQRFSCKRARAREIKAELDAQKA